MSRKLIEKSKSLGLGIFLALFFIGLMTLSILIIKGVVSLGAILLPFLQKIFVILLLILLFIIAPLLIFKRTRILVGHILIISSFIFGLTLFFYSALTAYLFWGFTALLIGIIFVGAGVVPVALLAALFNGSWAIMLEIILMLVFTIGSRILGFYIIEKN